MNAAINTNDSTGPLAYIDDENRAWFSFPAGQELYWVTGRKGGTEDYAVSYGDLVRRGGGSKTLGYLGQFGYTTKMTNAGTSKAEILADGGTMADVERVATARRVSMHDQLLDGSYFEGAAPRVALTPEERTRRAVIAEYAEIFAQKIAKATGEDVTSKGDEGKDFRDTYYETHRAIVDKEVAQRLAALAAHAESEADVDQAILDLIAAQKAAKAAKAAEAAKAAANGTAGTTGATGPAGKTKGKGKGKGSNQPSA